MKKLILTLASALVVVGCQGENTNSTPQVSQIPAARDVPVVQAPAVEREVAPAIDFEGFDESVRPQDDFFRFVNGTWLKETEIPEDKSSYSVFNILRDNSRDAVKEIIEDLAASEDLAQGTAAQQVADFYRSFMDAERINSLGVEPVRSELDRVEAISSKQELARYWGRAGRVGISRPFVYWVNQDAKQTDEYIIYFHQSGLGLPDRDYYFDQDEKAEANRAAYVEYLTTLFSLAEIDDAAGKAQSVFELEKSLAEHHWTRVENRNRDKTYNKVERAAMAEVSPATAWDEFLPAASLGEQAAFIVRQPSYFEGLSAVIEATSLASWKTYMTARVLSDAAPYLSDEFFNANFAFYSKQLNGIEQAEDRWKRGVRLVNGTVGELVGKEYVKRYFTPAAKERMVELVDNLRVAMGQSIDGLEWMSAETKKEAHSKLAKFTPKIGYPDQWRDYTALEVAADDLVGNLERLSEFQYAIEMKKLGGPIDRSEWFMNPQTVNAYYNPSMNEIVFPAAILQPPFFNLDADDAVNYGAIGVVIGHEIGHGFDDQGRKSDGDGTLRDWWTEQDAAEYTQRADKLVDQYEGYYPLEDEHINGRLTLGENLGDLGGLALAWRANQLAKGDNEPEPIEGYSAEQRFFLSFSQIWRGKYREEAMRNQLKTNPHSPGEYRVMGSLPNFDPFYEVFDVKEGDAMYMPPEERVAIW